MKDDPCCGDSSDAFSSSTHRHYGMPEPFVTTSVPPSQDMHGGDSLTQNELTQCVDDLEDTQDPFSQSQSQSQSQHASYITETPTVDPLTVPWGRLVPQANHPSRTSYEFLPRRPLEHVGSATRSRSISSNRLHVSLEDVSAVGGVYSSPPVGRGGGGGRDAVGSGGERDRHPGMASSPAVSPPSTCSILLLSQGINFIGLRNIRPFDRFNEYVIGRSRKCDVVIQKTVCQKEGEDEKTRSLRNIIHSIISNTHCRIYCLLKTGSGSSPGSSPEMEVYIEDSSGNGTIVNHTTLLKRYERRILYTGDTICLLNPKIVRKKVKDPALQKELLDHYSFVFINVHQTQGMCHNTTHTGTKPAQPLLSSLQAFGHEAVESDSCHEVTTPVSATYGTTNHCSARRRGLVDVRSTHSKSVTSHGGESSMTAVLGVGVSSSSISSARRKLDTSMGMMPPPQKRQRAGSSDNNNNMTTRVLRSASLLRRIENEYDLRDEIGSGTCGQVRRAIHRKSGEMVAVKVIAIGGPGGIHRTLSKVSKEGILDPNVQAEVSILQSLDHPYIVKLLDVFVHPGKAVYLVMELLQGGDLFDRIVHKGRYSELESRRIMRRMLAALYYLHHERDIVHRDLKPENILCVSKSDDITVKLTDFGLAKSITEDGLKTFCGTPQYFAPEVLSRRTSIEGTGRYGKEADMWSLGVILYILISGTPPFDATMDASVSNTISFSESIWRSTSLSVIDLISKMLTKDPTKRIGVVDACSHEWIMTPDGDTHIHPLEDPVVMEARNRKNLPILSTSNSVIRTEKLSNSSNLEERDQGKRLEFSSPRPNQTHVPEDETPTLPSSNVTKEMISPNQSAQFPTPIRVPESRISDNASKKRDSLFSLVKQLSNESADKLAKGVSDGDERPREDCPPMDSNHDDDSINLDGVLTADGKSLITDTKMKI